MGLRLTPQTTARSQANRITLWLIGWEVETPLISGVQSLRCCWPAREEPGATMHRDIIGLWNVDSAWTSTWEDSFRHQSLAVVPNSDCKACLRRANVIIVVPFAIDKLPKASSYSSVTADAHCLGMVIALCPP